MQRTCLLLPLLALAPFVAQAQTITDVPRATIALDSLQQAANTIRQQALARSYRVEVKAPRTGKRRQQAKGFDASYSGNSTWRKKTILRRNGVLIERFTASQDGQSILRERRVNGTTQYLWFRTTPTKSTGSAANSSQALYLRSGYLQWNGRQYLLPTLAPLTGPAR